MQALPQLKILVKDAEASYFKIRPPLHAIAMNQVCDVPFTTNYNFRGIKELVNITITGIACCVFNIFIQYIYSIHFSFVSSLNLLIFSWREYCLSFYDRTQFDTELHSYLRRDRIYCGYFG
jgi:hypothetical protein